MNKYNLLCIGSYRHSKFFSTKVIRKNSNTKNRALKFFKRPVIMKKLKKLTLNETHFLMFSSLIMAR